MHCEGVLIADARKTEPLAARGKPQGAKHKAGRSRGAPPELPVGTITRLRKPQQTGFQNVPSWFPSNLRNSQERGNVRQQAHRKCGGERQKQAGQAHGASSRTREQVGGRTRWQVAVLPKAAGCSAVHAFRARLDHSGRIGLLADVTGSVRERQAVRGRPALYAW